jgi:hypothetical protein
MARCHQQWHADCKATLNNNNPTFFGVGVLPEPRCELYRGFLALVRLKLKIDFLNEGMKWWRRGFGENLRSEFEGVVSSPHCFQGAMGLSCASLRGTDRWLS